MYALDLAFRLNGAVRTQEVSLDAFRKGYRLDSGQEQHVRPEEDLTDQELQVSAQNLQVIALGASAIVVDSSLDLVFGAKDPSDQSQLGKARRVMYMIRCAFAHSPIFPVWIIKPNYQVDTVIQLSSDCQIQVRLGSLNGKPVKPDDLGGINSYLLLVEYCRNETEQAN